MRQNLDTGILNSHDKGRELGVGGRTLGQALIIVGQDETENQQVDNIEEEDTPEHLLGGLGNSLSGVGRLGSSKTAKLRSREGESSGREDTGKTVEAVVEGTGIVPISCADVSLVSDTTTVVNYTEQDETDTGADLDDGQDEFDFTVSTDTKNLNNDEQDQENTDPNSDIEIRSPERNGKGGSRELKRQDTEPGECVVQTDGETPRWVNEANDISEEGAIDGIEHSHFSQGLHGEEQHETDDNVANDLLHLVLQNAKLW